MILQKSREYLDLLFYWLLNLTNFWSDNIRKESNPKVELFNLTTLRVVDTPIYWHYDESSVTSEGESYLPDGLMEGCTLTFYPSQKGDVTVFEVEDIRVNEMVAGAYADPATSTSSKLADIHEDLPEVMRQIFGDEIIIQSPMYRNSCFTIFVNFCGDGSIYGQWSGRNLPATAKQNAQNARARMEENITSDAFLLGLDTVYVDDYVEAVRRSLADEYIFNELLDYVCTNNVSCYINSDDESVLESERVYFSDSTEEYIVDLGDADWNNVKGIAAGNMTGLTLTGSVSEHDGEMVISTKDIVLNKFIRDKSLVATGRDANTPKYLCGVTPDYEKRGCLYDEEDYGGELFNRLRAIIGESPQICSECYRNSEYTIFIRMTDDPEGLIVVYGQWNGTNIS